MTAQQKKKSASGAKRKPVNMFHPEIEPRHHAMCELLLTGKEVSADDLREAAGFHGIGRSLGLVLLCIEDQGGVLRKVRKQQEGSTKVYYKYFPESTFTYGRRITDPRHRDSRMNTLVKSWRYELKKEGVSPFNWTGDENV